MNRVVHEAALNHLVSRSFRHRCRGNTKVKNRTASDSRSLARLLTDKLDSLKEYLDGKLQVEGLARTDARGALEVACRVGYVPKSFGCCAKERVCGFWI